MFFSLQSIPAVASPTHCATDATLRCLLAYGVGLEDCRISVEFSDCGVILTGRAPSKAAVRTAVNIVADFTSRPVHSCIQVKAPQ